MASQMETVWISECGRDCAHTLDCPLPRCLFLSLCLFPSASLSLSLSFFLSLSLTRSLSLFSHVAFLYSNPYAALTCTVAHFRFMDTFMYR